MVGVAEDHATTAIAEEIRTFISDSVKRESIVVCKMIQGQGQKRVLRCFSYMKRNLLLYLEKRHDVDKRRLIVHISITL